MVERKHTHKWEYSATGNTITAECKDDFGTCDITTGLILTISVPENLTYDGNAKSATLNNDYNTTVFPDKYEIKYYIGESEIADENVKNACDYTAKVTVGTDEDAVIAEMTFTINKANSVAATVTANNRTYDGTEEPLVTVTGEATGGTMRYAVTTVDQEPDDDAYNFDNTSIPTATDAGT